MKEVRLFSYYQSLFREHAMSCQERDALLREREELKSQFKDAQAAATADFDGLVANTAQEMKELEDEVKALKKKLKETSSAAADFEARYIKAKSAAQIAEGNFISYIILKSFAFVFISTR